MRRDTHKHSSYCFYQLSKALTGHANELNDLPTLSNEHALRSGKHTVNLNIQEIKGIHG